MTEMTTAYIRYCAERELRGRRQNEEWEDLEATSADLNAGDGATVEEVYEIKVVDMFGALTSRRAFTTFNFKSFLSRNQAD